MAEEKPNRLKLAALVLAIVGAAALPFACDDRQAEPAPGTATPANKTAASTSAAVAEAPAPGRPPAAQTGAVRWKKPAAWQDGKSASAMRLATYILPKADGDTEASELSVVVAGGTAETNIERWEGQFGGAKAKTGQKNPNEVTVSLVEIQGEYAGGGPAMGGTGGKHANWMLLGAIVSLNPGEHYFFKLVGPRASLEAARPDFDALVASISKQP